MKLSIVTISYNNLSGLKKTTESIRSQTWKEYEWIIIDGGSTDGTKEFLQSLSPQPDYWCCEKDNGIYDAQNKGILLAKGEYVCCMNSGDTFCNAKTLKKVFTRKPTADIVYGDWKRVFPLQEFVCYSPKKMPPYFFFYNNICHQAMFVRTSILQKSGFDLSYKIYADWAKWRQLMLEGCSFEYVPVTVCNFEANMGACEQDTLARKAEYKKLYDEMPDAVRKEINEFGKVYDVALVGFYPVDNGTIIWRLNFLKEMLDAKGYRTVVTTRKTTRRETFDIISKAKKVILCRPSLDDTGNDVIRYCIENQKPFLIDFDDALFHDDVFCDGAFMSGVCGSNDIKSAYKNVADGIFFADKLIVSTPKIKELLWNKYKKDSIVRPNVISQSLCNKKQQKDGETLNILYASGTATHLHDLSTIYLDLLIFMKRHQDVTLTILGESMDTEEILWSSDRVRRRPYVPFKKMLDVYSEHNLLLAPLAKSDFNDAKSNIKFIEAGAMGVAVLASDCAEFASAITDGVNGFLYSDNFLEKLEYIYKNRKKLVQIGENAFNDVVSKHSTICDIDKALIDWLDSY